MAASKPSANSNGNEPLAETDFVHKNKNSFFFVNEPFVFTKLFIEFSREFYGNTAFRRKGKK